ncbi:beta-L-arabinofuranosidase domain-containing protein [Micromonospora pallida]|uniref:beta-L-arabinofuranosidase domain-containing protein n=1 Tax=Micromonospora pallida TaxID=145854 RepID=UPI001FE1866D|nr:beta-L-arabinofuranosidase domain-containing protein [Micromonospora pallida]
MRLGRRGLLGGLLGAGLAVGLGGLPAYATTTAGTAGAGAPPLASLPLDRVQLLESRFLANMRRTTAYLRVVDLDRLLHTFRLTVGLPSTAQPCGGWEAPNVQLRGHTTGHLLSGLALAAANTGDAELAAKGARLVAALAECQVAAAKTGSTPGYLSAFPETAFDDIEAGKNVWAPYYTIHKIMAGLLDQHVLLGNAQALTVLLGMVDWVDTRTSRLSREALQKVLHTEFGGMNEVLANLWFVTRDERHLELAARFDHDEIFGPLAERRNTLAGRHANTDIAKVVGAAAQWEATGEERYRTIATYFWDQVVQHHTYVIGGNSNAEFFGPPGQIVSQLGENTCENCNSYNMLKLTRQLFRNDPDRAAYMDYYEWTLLNQMLGEQDPDSAHGFVTYYTGLSNSASRQGKGGLVSDPGTYSSDYDNFSCDHGTALETQVKFADSVYFTRGDVLWVNLFVPSELDWREQGLRLRMQTDYPYDPTVRLTVDRGGDAEIRVRVPGWVERTGQPAKLRVNGRSVGVVCRPGAYVAVRRTWAAGDIVELSLPMATVWRPAPDNPAVHALTYGPLVLAGRYGDTPPATLPTIEPSSLTRVAGTADFTVLADGRRVRLSPFLDVHHEHYNVYWAVRPGRPAPKLVARYAFDDSAGLVDSTGRWADAALAGGASFVGRDGGGAVALDGQGGHVVLPAGLPTNLTELTVSVWTRLESVANSARVFDLGSNAQTYMFLTSRTGRGTARFAMKLGGMETEDFVDADRPLPTGVWTHVAVTVAPGVARLYLDGEQVGINEQMVMSPLLLGATQQNFLGRSQNVKHPWLHGAVGDFRLYGVALSAGDVAALHAGTFHRYE